ncbi:MAG: hypothetical protein QMC78_00255 [Methanocellales archaeon]|nr:hypothetical protein [Methanocellales archaeon]
MEETSTTTKLNETLKSLEETMDELKELGYPIGRVRSIYGELYTAKKLIDLQPQVGRDREYTRADIYLSKICKLVEVKSCEKNKMTENATWVWTFGEKQITKFDYAVLIGFGENSFDIEKVFVLSHNELEGWPVRKDNVRKKGTVYISYYDNFEDYEKDVEEDVKKGVKNAEIEIEKELNKYSEKFENRWDKIR